MPSCLYSKPVTPPPSVAKKLEQLLEGETLGDAESREVIFKADRNVHSDERFILTAYFTIVNGMPSQLYSFRENLENRGAVHPGCMAHYTVDLYRSDLVDNMDVDEYLLLRGRCFEEFRERYVAAHVGR